MVPPTHPCGQSNLAISLFHKIVDDPEITRSVLDVVRRELLTPYGLRTLSPRDPAYRGRYEGSVAARDAAYHQGTVWPWLIQSFLSAYRESGGTESQAREWLQPLIEYRDGPGLGNLPEIFDGDPPHRPCGAMAQAWSSAALAALRLD